MSHVQSTRTPAHRCDLQQYKQRYKQQYGAFRTAPRRFLSVLLLSRRL